jgi:hypothetical protein
VAQWECRGQYGGEMGLIREERREPQEWVWRAEKRKGPPRVCVSRCRAPMSRSGGLTLPEG